MKRVANETLILGMYQICNSLDCQWSLADRGITIKKKGHPPKDGLMPMANKKIYECTLNRLVKKYGQMFINYYFNEEDIEEEERSSALSSIVQFWYSKQSKTTKEISK
eukprot:1550512-Ditylum_brightwellii.AAC.1